MTEKPSLEIPERLANDVSAVVTRMQSKPAIRAVLQLQESSLPGDLKYHSYVHVLEVFNEVVLFAVHDSLPDSDIELLSLAAAFHDAGYLQRWINNEILGAELAVQHMQADGSYSEQQCALVHQMILDTAVVETPAGPRQIPSTPLSGYLLDADMANLGRLDFFEKTEALRQESGQPEDIFYQKTLEMLQAHSFYSPAAGQLRGARKLKNIAKLQRRLVKMRQSGEQLSYFGVSLDRLGFLTQLPVLLNSSLETREIIRRTLGFLSEQIAAEAATVFLNVPESKEIEFWALHGGTSELAGQRLQRGTGIVGWVIDHNEGVRCSDAASDPRFFGAVDTDAGFHTRDMLCVPLCVRGDTVIGALQCLNSTEPPGFVNQDLLFVEHVARHVSLALENARLFQQLEAQNAKLEKLDRRRSEQVALIAHEFRTPLNVIHSASELIGDSSPESVSLKRLLQNGVARLVRLIDEIRTLSVVSKDGFAIDIESFPVADVLESIRVHFEPIAAGRQLVFSVEYADSCFAVGDMPLILVVLNNLVSNAIRFTGDNGRIDVRARVRSGQVEFSVTDTGIGISEADMSIIFSKFYEVQDIYQHSSGTYEFKSSGLGLGLSTVQSILHAHGSSVHVSSAVDKGSTFSFRLPASGKG